MKKEKPYIIYTKKNKEQVFKYLNNFNIYKVYRTINKNRGYDPENNFELNEDIEDSIELKNKFRFLRQYTISISKNDMFGENNINYKTIDKYNIYYIDKEDYNCESGVIRSKNLIF